MHAVVSLAGLTSVFISRYLNMTGYMYGIDYFSSSNSRQECCFKIERNESERNRPLISRDSVFGLLETSVLN